MPDPQLSNARVYAWLADQLAAVADEAAATKVQVNSAAVWWLARLPRAERARILGEFTTFQAMRTAAPPAPAANHRPKAGRRNARG